MWFDFWNHWKHFLGGAFTVFVIVVVGKIITGNLQIRGFIPLSSSILWFCFEIYQAIKRKIDDGEAHYILHSLADWVFAVIGSYSVYCLMRILL